MQAKKRYILVFVSCAFLAYCYFGGYRLKSTRYRRRMTRYKSALSMPADSHISQLSVHHLPSFMSITDASDSLKHIDPYVAEIAYSIRNSTFSMRNNRQQQSGSQMITTETTKTHLCRMETCFDYSRCYSEFLVYVYPPEPRNSLGATPPNSVNYQKLITAIRESRYYTSNPERACLFVLGIDTLDRDSLSEDYVRNVPSRLTRLPYWNNGRNHVIFNLYSGTWPDYVEYSLGFNTGEAILAKASMSVLHIRPDFDVSIPLFHKQFPLRAGSTGLATTMNFPSRKKYLLAFKGKR